MYFGGGENRYGGRKGDILDYKTIQQYIAILLVLSLVECIDRKALNCLFLRIGMCVIYNSPLYCKNSGTDSGTGWNQEVLPRLAR